MGSFWDLLGVIETDVLFPSSADFKESCTLWEMLIWFFSRIADCLVNYTILTTFHFAVRVFFPLFCALGWRIGKGEGYADMEYAMMVSMGAVQEDTPVVTIVHDCQVSSDAQIFPLQKGGNSGAPPALSGDMEWCWFGIFIPIVSGGFSCDKTSGMGHSFREFVFF